MYTLIYIYVYWSALGKWMFERLAKVLTFFGRTPKIYYQENFFEDSENLLSKEFQHLRAPELPKDVFPTPLCPEHPLWNLELSIR